MKIDTNAASAQDTRNVDPVEVVHTSSSAMLNLALYQEKKKSGDHRSKRRRSNKRRRSRKEEKKKEETDLKADDLRDVEGLSDLGQEALWVETLENEDTKSKKSPLFTLRSWGRKKRKDPFKNVVLIPPADTRAERERQAAERADEARSMLNQVLSLDATSIASPHQIEQDEVTIHEAFQRAHEARRLLDPPTTPGLQTVLSLESTRGERAAIQALRVIEQASHQNYTTQLPQDVDDDDDDVASLRDHKPLKLVDEVKLYTPRHVLEAAEAYARTARQCLERILPHVMLLEDNTVFVPNLDSPAPKKKRAAIATSEELFPMPAIPATPHSQYPDISTLGFDNTIQDRTETMEDPNNTNSPNSRGVLSTTSLDQLLDGNTNNEDEVAEAQRDGQSKHFLVHASSAKVSPLSARGLEPEFKETGQIIPQSPRSHGVEKGKNAFNNSPKERLAPISESSKLDDSLAPDSQGLCLNPNLPNEAAVIELRAASQQKLYCANGTEEQIDNPDEGVEVAFSGTMRKSTTKSSKRNSPSKSKIATPVSPTKSPRWGFQLKHGSTTKSVAKVGNATVQPPPPHSKEQQIAETSKSTLNDPKNQESVGQAIGRDVAESGAAKPGVGIGSACEVFSKETPIQSSKENQTSALVIAEGHVSAATEASLLPYSKAKVGNLETQDLPAAKSESMKISDNVPASPFKKRDIKSNKGDLIAAPTVVESSNPVAMKSEKPIRVIASGVVATDIPPPPSSQAPKARRTGKNSKTKAEDSTEQSLVTLPAVELAPAESTPGIQSEQSVIAPVSVEGLTASAAISWWGSKTGTSPTKTRPISKAGPTEIPKSSRQPMEHPISETSLPSATHDVNTQASDGKKSVAAGASRAVSDNLTMPGVVDPMVKQHLKLSIRQEGQDTLADEGIEIPYSQSISGKQKSTKRTNLQAKNGALSPTGSKPASRVLTRPETTSNISDPRSPTKIMREPATLSQTSTETTMLQSNLSNMEERALDGKSSPNSNSVFHSTEDQPSARKVGEVKIDDASTSVALSPGHVNHDNDEGVEVSYPQIEEAKPSKSKSDMPKSTNLASPKIWSLLRKSKHAAVQELKPTSNKSLEAADVDQAAKGLPPVGSPSKHIIDDSRPAADLVTGAVTDVPVELVAAAKPQPIHKIEDEKAAEACDGIERILTNCTGSRSELKAEAGEEIELLAADRNTSPPTFRGSGDGLAAMPQSKRRLSLWSSHARSKTITRSQGSPSCAFYSKDDQPVKKSVKDTTRFISSEKAAASNNTEKSGISNTERLENHEKGERMTAATSLDSKWNKAPSVQNQRGLMAPATSVKKKSLEAPSGQNPSLLQDVSELASPGQALIVIRQSPSVSKATDSTSFSRNATETFIKDFQDETLSNRNNLLQESHVGSAVVNSTGDQKCAKENSSDDEKDKNAVVVNTHNDGKNIDGQETIDDAFYQVLPITKATSTYEAIEHVLTAQTATGWAESDKVSNSHKKLPTTTTSGVQNLSKPSAMATAKSASNSKSPQNTHKARFTFWPRRSTVTTMSGTQGRSVVVQDATNSNGDKFSGGVVARSGDVVSVALASNSDKAKSDDMKQDDFDSSAKPLSSASPPQPKDANDQLMRGNDPLILWSKSKSITGDTQGATNTSTEQQIADASGDDTGVLSRNLSAQQSFEVIEFTLSKTNNERSTETTGVQERDHQSLSKDLNGPSSLKVIGSWLSSSSSKSTEGPQAKANTSTDQVVAEAPGDNAENPSSPLPISALSFEGIEYTLSKADPEPGGSRLLDKGLSNDSAGDDLKEKVSWLPWGNSKSNTKDMQAEVNPSAVARGLNAIGNSTENPSSVLVSEASSLQGMEYPLSNPSQYVLVAGPPTLSKDSLGGVVKEKSSWVSRSNSKSNAEIIQAKANTSSDQIVAGFTVDAKEIPTSTLSFEEIEYTLSKINTDAAADATVGGSSRLLDHPSLSKDSTDDKLKNKSWLSWSNSKASTRDQQVEKVLIDQLDNASSGVSVNRSLAVVQVAVSSDGIEHTLSKIATELESKSPQTKTKEDLRKTTVSVNKELQSNPQKPTLEVPKQKDLSLNVPGAEEEASMTAKSEINVEDIGEDVCETVKAKKGVKGFQNGSTKAAVSKSSVIKTSSKRSLSTGGNANVTEDQGFGTPQNTLNAALSETEIVSQAIMSGFPEAKQGKGLLPPEIAPQPSSLEIEKCSSLAKAASSYEGIEHVLTESHSENLIAMGNEEYHDTTDLISQHLAVSADSKRVSKEIIADTPKKQRGLSFLGSFKRGIKPLRDAENGASGGRPRESADGAAADGAMLKTNPASNRSVDQTSLLTNLHSKGKMSTPPENPEAKSSCIPDITADQVGDELLRVTANDFEKTKEAGEANADTDIVNKVEKSVMEKADGVATDEVLSSPESPKRKSAWLTAFAAKSIKSEKIKDTENITDVRSTKIDCDAVNSDGNNDRFGIAPGGTTEGLHKDDETPTQISRPESPSKLSRWIPLIAKRGVVDTNSDAPQKVEQVRSVEVDAVVKGHETLSPHARPESPSRMSRWIPLIAKRSGVDEQTNDPQKLNQVRSVQVDNEAVGAEGPFAKAIAESDSNVAANGANALEPDKKMIVDGSKSVLQHGGVTPVKVFVPPHMSKVDTTMSRDLTPATLDDMVSLTTIDDKYTMPADDFESVAPKEKPKAGVAGISAIDMMPTSPDFRDIRHVFSEDVAKDPGESNGVDDSIAANLPNQPLLVAPIEVGADDEAMVADKKALNYAAIQQSLQSGKTLFNASQQHPQQPMAHTTSFLDGDPSVSESLVQLLEDRKEEICQEKATLEKEIIERRQREEEERLLRKKERAQAIWALLCCKSTSAVMKANDDIVDPLSTESQDSSLRSMDENAEIHNKELEEASTTEEAVSTNGKSPNRFFMPPFGRGRARDEQVASTRSADSFAQSTMQDDDAVAYTESELYTSATTGTERQQSMSTYGKSTTRSWRSSRRGSADDDGDDVSTPLLSASSEAASTTIHDHDQYESRDDETNESASVRRAKSYNEAAKRRAPTASFAPLEIGADGGASVRNQSVLLNRSELATALNTRALTVSADDNDSYVTPKSVRDDSALHRVKESKSFAAMVRSLMSKPSSLSSKPSTDASESNESSSRPPSSWNSKPTMSTKSTLCM